MAELTSDRLYFKEKKKSIARGKKGIIRKTKQKINVSVHKNRATKCKKQLREIIPEFWWEIPVSQKMIRATSGKSVKIWKV